MDDLTRFSAFENAVTRRVNDFVSAWEQRKWFMLFSYVFFVLFISVSSIGLFINGLQAFGLIKENLFAPQRELTYEKESEVQTDGGEYMTIYTLTLNTPPGNNSRFLFSYPKGCSDNLKFIEGGVSMRDGLVYKEDIWEAVCITKEKIEDNYRLFELQ